MEAYGSQLTPLLKTLIWHGGLPAIEAGVSFHGRALGARACGTSSSRRPPPRDPACRCERRQEGPAIDRPLHREVAGAAAAYPRSEATSSRVIARPAA